MKLVCTVLSRLLRIKDDKDMRYWCGTKRDVGVGKKLQWNLDIVDILGGTFLYTISSFPTIYVQFIQQNLKSVTEKITLH